MKKYFFMALLASLFLLPGCKKESKTDPTPTPDPVVKNPLVEYYDLCRAICYVDTTTVFEKLDNDGWTIIQDDTVRVYKKLDGNNISIELGIRDESGVVSGVNVELIDQNVNTALINAEAFQGCISHIGDSCTIAGVDFSFRFMLYYIGDNPSIERDFTEILNNVIEIYCNGQYVGLIWADSDDNHTILLSKVPDEDSGKNAIHINIG